ncbi:hypothetical protein GCM10027073_03740 [Streptomyces chlorus]|uniref:Helix-turn-helix domain-containing protein n=1 Tax=Streptomyces chlorus TaxID=887452 RepID=A0ABW1DVJ1_9ACTN
MYNLSTRKRALAMVSQGRSLNSVSHETGISRAAIRSWQQALADEYPWEFVRGLIHSDGCRITNWTTRMVRGERKRYEYPRYFFTNLSADIIRLFTTPLDQVGVEWRQPSPRNVSVAKKASVALMDLHVGPKY